MNKLGAAILMISQGTPFWQAGEEMLRTKDGDENSYKSSDAINNINWSVLAEGTREYEIPTGLGTPAQSFAGPPRVVRFKHHVSLSDLLS